MGCVADYEEVIKWLEAPPVEFLAEFHFGPDHRLVCGNPPDSRWMFLGKCECQRLDRSMFVALERGIGVGVYAIYNAPIGRWALWISSQGDDA